jgi:S1-C subfamily serine protease
MYGNTLDLVLLAATVVFAVVGYRQGLVIGVLSFVGFFGGALLGVQVAPVLAERFDDDRARLVVALAVAFAVAICGQTLAVFIGNHVRARMGTTPLRILDNVGGAVALAVAFLLVAWTVAAPLASSPAPWLAAEVRRSAVLTTVDGAVPEGVRNLYTSFSKVVRRGDFPDVLGGLTPTQVTPVGAPDGGLASSAVVRSVQGSIGKITGVAPACGRQVEGSGFVYADRRVMTNAHVVAGVRSPRVQIGNRRYPARVVEYDPDRDLAVLYVPDLTASPLAFAPRARPGADAIVLGFPLDGPYTASPARIRDVRPIEGPNIYNSRSVERQVYTVRSRVRSGNSGGPLVAPNGSVYGVVFAAAADDPQTGFVLTAAEVASVAQRGATATQRVSTQNCT